MYILAILSVEKTDWPHPYFDPAQQKNFPETFSFCEFVSTCKKETVSLICSGKIDDLKILQSDLLRVFWPISQEQDFSQIKDLHRDTANITNFH